MGGCEITLSHMQRHKLRGIRRGVVHTHDRGMSIGCDNPKLILPVVRIDAVPVGPSSLVASRCRCGVLLRLDWWLGEDGRLEVSGGGLNHRPVLVLVKLANAKTEVVDDAFVFLAP